MNKLKSPFRVLENLAKLSKEEDISVNRATSNIQDSNKSDIVFYNLKNTKIAKDIFLKRLGSSKPGLIVTTIDIKDIYSGAYLVVDEKDFLRSQKLISDVFHPIPKALAVIGVTGTNGKTTTVDFSRQISSLLGKKAFSIGTLGVINERNEIIEELEVTTPSYIDLRRIIAKHASEYDACFMEVSSHALEQDRIYDIVFNCAAWTNFSQDHLDYHETMEDYFKSKLKIFTKTKGPVFVPKEEVDLIEKLNALELKCKETSTLNDKEMVCLPPFLQLDYNLSNLELALSLNNYLWKNKGKINFAGLKMPRGRLSLINLKRGKVIIDYAHTPEALKKVLSIIKKVMTDIKIKVLFGCGGDRDKKKRPLMGAAASSMADFVYVTSDNPRSEDPEEIINQIVPGIKGKYEIIIDREKAIVQAINVLEDNEVLVIAGKGHEEYQEIKGKKYKFSDFEIVENFIK